MDSPFKYLFLIISCILLSLACNEVDVPEPPAQAEPVFSMQLDIDGSSTNLAAGRDNYFMFANYEVGHDNVLRLIGILRPEDCQDLCPGSFRFVMTDIAQYAPELFRVDRILNRGVIPFQWDIDPNRIRIQLQDHSNAASSVRLIRTWEYEDKMSHDSSIVFTTRKENQPKICLTLKTANDEWESTFCRVIEPGENNNCKALLNFHIEDRAVVLSVRGDIGMSRIKWSNGSTESSIKVRFERGASYSVELTDNEGCNIVVGIRFGNRMIDEAFHSFFTVESTSVRAQPEMNLGSVRIDFRNGGGELYSTRFFRQPNDSYFEITSVSDFDETEDGKKTKKLGVRFSCLLYNERGDALKLNNGRGQIAIAYPD